MKTNIESSLSNLIILHFQCMEKKNNAEYHRSLDFSAFQYDIIYKNKFADMHKNIYNVNFYATAL